MDTVTIVLPGIKPFSINSYYIGRNRVRSPAARKWGESIHSLLVNYADAFDQFRNSFDPLKHALHIEICHYMPNLYNKDGCINHQSKDCSNVEKPLIDILTGQKYFERGETTLNIDDRNIVRMLSEKKISKEFSIVVKFTIVNNKI